MRRGSPKETIDYLRKWDIRVVQSLDGYRFSVDSLILASLARLPARGRVMDLGSGNGVVSFIVAKREPELEVVGLEIQRQMVERAVRGARLNGLEGRVKFVEGSFRDVQRLFPPESFSYVISNPPFWRPGTGRRPPSHEVAVARQEIEGTLADVVGAARYLLPTKGRFGVIMCAERLTELVCLSAEAGLEPKRVVFVHPRASEPAQFVFMEAVKNARPGGLEVEPPLVIYDEEGRYTERMVELTGVRWDAGC